MTVLTRLAQLAAPALHALPEESAHRLAIRALAAMPIAAPQPSDKKLEVEAFGLKFANPIGLAAGFDKNAEAVAGAFGLGFGFVEVGTLTPKPQIGNPKPRLFRLTEDAAIINRMGFNNCGHSEAHERLLRLSKTGVLGVNIGPNKDSPDWIANYVAGIKTFADVADYFTMNVSSPNTPGLRELQKAEALDALVVAVMDARESSSTRRPVLLKIAPDVTLNELDAIVAIARARKLDGMIVGNTTLSRPPNLQSPKKNVAGGLSGRPLFSRSTDLLAETAKRVERAFPLIGVGGIESFATARQKFAAGATLVQLYSGFVMRGPALVEEIRAGLAREK